MSELPQPLVPPEVDLRDFQYMPLYGDVLLDSETWLLCNAEEKVAALTLWWKSWHQLPAGSLPGDDRLLSPLAGYGVAVTAWQAVRRMALRGWVQCTDGRYYHRFLAARVAESWLGKMKRNWSRECDRLRKVNKRREEGGLPKLDFPAEPTIQTLGFPTEVVEFASGSAASFRRIAEVVPPETPPSFRRKEGPIPSKKALKGKGEGKGKGERDNSTPNGASLDLKAIVFGQCLDWLTQHTGKRKDQHRAILGRWCRDYGEAVVIEVFGAAQRHGPLEPIGWITKALSERKKPSSGPKSEAYIP